VTASHYSRDLQSCDLFNFNLIFYPVPLYRVFRMDAQSGKTEILVTIFDAPAAYMHSLFLTEHCVILCIWGSRYT
jgi:torulene dioxygenase